jgi:hypothetical protein
MGALEGLVLIVMAVLSLSSRPPALRGGAAQVPAIHVGAQITGVCTFGPT